MSVGLGDAATWSGVAVSFGMSLAALIVSIRSNRRIAEATERQAAAAENAVPTPPPAVAWRIEYRGKDNYRLRHMGTQDATGVKVDLARSPAVFGLELGNGVVEAGASLSFLIVEVAENPYTNELWVSWDGQTEPVPIPMP